MWCRCGVVRSIKVISEWVYFIRTFKVGIEKMREQSLYSTNEMRLVYASVISVSILSTLPMMIHVFMMDPVEFQCFTMKNETVLE